jgi:hypothetical protein
VDLPRRDHGEERGVKTIHQAIVDFNGKSYIFYHNAKLPTGGEFRRSVAVEELHYKPDGSIRHAARRLPVRPPIRPRAASDIRIAVFRRTPISMGISFYDGYNSTPTGF